MEVGFPFEVDERGRVADPPYEEHVRELIEQLLFTAPGERVNRPDLGAGLMQLLFAPLTSELVSVVQLRVMSELNRWLGLLIQAEAVRVEPSGSEVRVTVDYILRRNRQRKTAIFVAPREIR